MSDTNTLVKGEIKSFTNSKKRKRAPTLEELVERPWCYYCERSFEDLMVLTSHQKAKHFKCERCGRRLNTAGGLVVHLNQVHKESLTKVDNAREDRQDPTIEIFGMEGIPEEVSRQHRSKVVNEYREAVEERTALTGNPPPGTKPKPQKRLREDPEKLLKRLADFKRKKAEAKNAAANSMNGDLVTKAPPSGTHQPLATTPQPTQDPRRRPSAQAAEPPPTPADVDELVAAVQTEPKAARKTASKEGRPTKMSFSDANQDSPDESPSKFSKYAFDRRAADKANTVLAPVEASYAGVVGGTNEAVDREMDG